MSQTINVGTAAKKEYEQFRDDDDEELQ